MGTTVLGRAAWALTLIGALLSITGCGGGSSTAASSTSAPNGATRSNATGEAPAARSSFIEQADRLCGRVNAEVLAIKAKSESASEVLRIVPRTISVERKGVATLEQLQPPASLARDWQQMLSYRRTLASQLGKMVEIARKNDGTSIGPLGAAKERIHHSLSRTAKANGFKACAKVGGVG
jgi:hypothetical protein